MTGKGLQDLIREKFDAKITFYLMIGMFLTNMGNVISEFAGVAAGMEVFGVSKYVSVKKPCAPASPMKLRAKPNTPAISPDNAPTFTP